MSHPEHTPIESRIAPAGPFDSAAPAAAETGDSGHMPDQQAIEQMVAEAAYYLAQQRNFVAGYEEDDWLAAKAQIAAQLERADNPFGTGKL